MLRSFRTVRISVDHGQSRPGRALRRVDTRANLHSVKSFLLLLPTFLSLLIFCAHLFRAGALLLIPLVLFVLPLLLIKSGIVARLFQLLLLFIAMQWAIYAWMLADERMDAGRPWMRMAAILAGVGVLALISAALFEAPPLMRRYPRRFLS